MIGSKETLGSQLLKITKWLVAMPETNQFVLFMWQGAHIYQGHMFKHAFASQRTSSCTFLFFPSRYDGSVSLTDL